MEALYTVHSPTSKFSLFWSQVEDAFFDLISISPGTNLYSESIPLPQTWKSHLSSMLMCRLRKNGMNGSEAYQYFVLRAQKIALSHGYEIVNWYEIFCAMLYSLSVSFISYPPPFENLQGRDV